MDDFNAFKLAFLATFADRFASEPPSWKNVRDYLEGLGRLQNVEWLERGWRSCVDYFDEIDDRLVATIHRRFM